MGKREAHAVRFPWGFIKKGAAKTRSNVTPMMFA
jgi:hypothetical protein